MQSLAAVTTKLMVSDNNGQCRLSTKPKDSSQTKVLSNKTYQAIVVLWTRLDQMFGGAWSKNHGELGGDNFEYLCKLLVTKTPKDIQTGIKNIERSGTEFKPSLPELLKLCSAEVRHPCHNMINTDFMLPVLTSTDPPADFFTSIRKKIKCAKHG